MPEQSLGERFSRCAMTLPVIYRLVGGPDQKSRAGWTRDLSERGARPELPELLPQETRHRTLTVSCRRRGERGDPVVGQTRDLSRGGTSLRLSEPMPPGMPLAVTFPTAMGPGCDASSCVAMTSGKAQKSSLHAPPDGRGSAARSVTRLESRRSGQSASPSARHALPLPGPVPRPRDWAPRRRGSPRTERRAHD